jgi:uncharacterized protein YceH (UPF0502 family)
MDALSSHLVSQRVDSYVVRLLRGRREEKYVHLIHALVFWFGVFVVHMGAR